jgi:hypothetical protein
MQPCAEMGWGRSLLPVMQGRSHSVFVSPLKNSSATKSHRAAVIAVPVAMVVVLALSYALYRKKTMKYTHSCGSLDEHLIHGSEEELVEMK